MRREKRASPERGRDPQLGGPGAGRAVPGRSESTPQAPGARLG